MRATSAGAGPRSLHRSPPTRLTRGGLALVLAGVVTASGCTSEAPADLPESGTASTSDSAGASASPSGSADATGAAELPSGCADILPTVEVDKALGRQLDGTTLFIEGTPEPKIGRLGRVSCSYGVKKGQSSPPVLASYFTYQTAQDAADRIASAINSTRAAGQRTIDITVQKLPATLLVEAKQLTLVMAVKATTYSITVQASALAVANRGKGRQALQAMAAVMLAKLG